MTGDPVCPICHQMGMHFHTAEDVNAILYEAIKLHEQKDEKQQELIALLKDSLEKTQNKLNEAITKSVELSDNFISYVKSTAEIEKLSIECLYSYYSGRKDNGVLAGDTIKKIIEISKERK